MNISQRQTLVLKQTQKLSMTTELRQSIELLPLSTIELAEKIKSELIENPMLEEIETGEKKEPETYSVSEIRNLEKLEHQKNTDINYSDIYSIEKTSYTYDQDASDRNQKMIESSVKSENLSDYLISQFRLLDSTDEEIYIAEILISMIDEKGFIVDDLDQITKEMNLSLKKTNLVLKKIHNLDPIGIGAKNIEETLLIQAIILKPEEENLHTLIKFHFKDLEKLDYKKISKSMKISEEKVELLAKQVKKLEPFPANSFNPKKTDYVIPDVVISESEGQFSIFINDEWIPKIQVNKEYKDILTNSCTEAEKEFITPRVNQASWLIKSIHNRRQTLFRVVNSIIDFQIDFFRKGIQEIKPLTLKEIADKLDLHESTISRITTNKYAQTTWGILELKWFFSSGVKSQEGGKESSKKVQDMIRNIIKEETESSPISDQEIVEIIKEAGIDIARRTVSKYRKILRIPSSSQRKKVKELKSN